MWSRLDKMWSGPDNMWPGPDTNWSGPDKNLFKEKFVFQCRLWATVDMCFSADVPWLCLLNRSY